MIGANDQNSKFDVNVAALTEPGPRLKAFSLPLAPMLGCFGVAQSGGQAIGTMTAKDIVDFMTKHPFQGIAENWIKTHPGASERRYHEMEQVLETLKELGVDPVMTRGTSEFFRQSTESGLATRFTRKTDDVRAVPEELEKC